MLLNDGQEKMCIATKGNIQLFSGFADMYNENRPSFPKKAIDILVNYLNRKPCTVIDLGCGTGLSTMEWIGLCGRLIGVEPNSDMLSVAKACPVNAKIEFVQAAAERTGLDTSIADIIMCSQSFHWMDPKLTLVEVNRLLAGGGVFATVDYDWPAVCDWHLEAAVESLINLVKKIIHANPALAGKTLRYKKSEHLQNLKNSGFFRFCREIVFSTNEECTALRFTNMVLSQSSIQGILHTKAEDIEESIASLKQEADRYFNEKSKEIGICYRMRIGIK
jgi:ubiquinone/menaquinone biosynthesis C-methylase UbiE